MQSRGTRTTDSSSPIEAPTSFIRSASGAVRRWSYVAELVVTDLATEWKVNGICEQHARVIVWADEEGTGPDEAVFTVEIQPHLGAE
jgi:hypothetical protein